MRGIRTFERLWVAVCSADVYRCFQFTETSRMYGGGGGRGGVDERGGDGDGGGRKKNSVRSFFRGAAHAVATEPIIG